MRGRGVGADMPHTVSELLWRHTSKDCRKSSRGGSNEVRQTKGRGDTVG